MTQADDHEREVLELITRRDELEEIADQLAGAIAEHLQVDIGEHSSANDPWARALHELAEADPPSKGTEALAILRSILACSMSDPNARSKSPCRGRWRTVNVPYALIEQARECVRPSAPGQQEPPHA